MLYCPNCRQPIPERNQWQLVEIVRIRTVAPRANGMVTCGQAVEFFLEPADDETKGAIVEKIRILVDKERQRRGKNGESEITGFDRKPVKPCLCTEHIRRGEFRCLKSRRVLPGLV